MFKRKVITYEILPRYYSKDTVPIKSFNTFEECKDYLHQNKIMYLYNCRNIDCKLDDYTVKKVIRKSSKLIDWFNTNISEVNFVGDIIDKYHLENLDNWLDEKNFWPVYHFAVEFMDMPALNGRTLSNEDFHYGIKSTIEKLSKLFEESQQPYVIEGSDWPYWFRIDNKTIPSNTSNWFRFLYEKYNFFAKDFLVPYNGPDKEDEHKRN